MRGIQSIVNGVPMPVRVGTSMALEPAAGGEVCGDAGGEQREADAERTHTQPISIRPFSIKRSRRASTRTSTAASTRKEEQRCAETEMKSKKAEESSSVTPLPPETAGGTRLRREVGCWTGLIGRSCRSGTAEIDCS